MTPDDRNYLGRAAAFPPEIQGEWVEDSDPTLVLILSGSEMIWRGDRKEYKDKTVELHEDGSISVAVEFSDQVDSGERNACPPKVSSRYYSSRNKAEERPPIPVRRETHVDLGREETRPD